jgi:diphthine-ammonia ligase
MTIPKPRAAISWSGGKDGCAALLRARSEYDVAAMITMFDEDAARSRSHGLRPEVLAAQAARLGLRSHTARCSWDTYDEAFSHVLASLAAEDTTHIVFGDILFEEHRRWAEDICAPHGLIAVEPLWGARTDDLFEEWVASGSRAMIVTARAEHLDHTWLGRTLTRDMAAAFERLGVDPCGERGEYHTVVTDTPVFTSPLALRPGAHVLRSGCWALDVTLADTATAPERAD